MEVLHWAHESWFVWDYLYWNTDVINSSREEAEDREREVESAQIENISMNMILSE